MENLQANLTLIQQRLAAASDGKYPVPKLIAVANTHPAEDILPLQNLGVTDIGENKVRIRRCWTSCSLICAPSLSGHARRRFPASR